MATFSAGERRPPGGAGAGIPPSSTPPSPVEISIRMSLAEEVVKNKGAPRGAEVGPVTAVLRCDCSLLARAFKSACADELAAIQYCGAKRGIRPTCASSMEKSRASSGGDGA